MTLGAGINAAYKVNDWLSVGGRPLALFGDLAGEVGFGGMLGVTLTPRPGTRFGVSWISPVKLDFKDVLATASLGPATAAIVGRLQASDHRLDLGITVPQQVMLSGYHEISPTCAMTTRSAWPISSCMRAMPAWTRCPAGSRVTTAPISTTSSTPPWSGASSRNGTMRPGSLAAVLGLALLAGCAQSPANDRGLQEFPGIEQQIRSFYDGNATEKEWSCPEVQMSTIDKSRVISQSSSQVKIAVGYHFAALDDNRMQGGVVCQGFSTRIFTFDRGADGTLNPVAMSGAQRGAAG